jgi:hypothetical protein
MGPPESMLCQECPWYKSAHEKSSSGFIGFLEGFAKREKERAIQDGSYKEAIRKVYDKYASRLGWNPTDEELEAFLTEIIGVQNRKAI